MKARKFLANLKEFFKELFGYFLLLPIVLFLLLIGVAIISLFPEKVSVILSENIELVLIIGFFALLAILYVISKSIELARKIKAKSSKTDNPTTQEENTNLPNGD